MYQTIDQMQANEQASANRPPRRHYPVEAEYTQEVYDELYERQCQRTEMRRKRDRLAWLLELRNRVVDARGYARRSEWAYIRDLTRSVAVLTRGIEDWDALIAHLEQEAGE